MGQEEFKPQDLFIHGHQKFPHIFLEGKIGEFKINNRVKYAACSVSGFNTEEGFVWQRELARDEVIARTGAGILTNQGDYPDVVQEKQGDLKKSSPP